MRNPYWIWLTRFEIPSGRSVVRTALCLAGDRLEQPGSRVSPVPLCGCGRNVKGSRSLFDRQSGEVAKFDELSLDRIARSELVERFVQSQQVLRGLWSSDLQVVQPLLDLSAAALLTAPTSGGFHQDAAHGLGCGSKEMAAMVPLVAARCTHQPNICLVNESGRLKRVSGRLGSQPGSGKAAQLVVDQGQQLSGRMRVAPVDRIQKLRHFGNVVTCNCDSTA